MNETNASKAMEAPRATPQPFSRLSAIDFSSCFVALDYWNSLIATSFRTLDFFRHFSKDRLAGAVSYAFRNLEIVRS